MEFDFAQQAQLAQQVSAILIPYLVKGAEAFAGETVKRLAAALWDKFKPKVEEKEAAKEIIQDLKENPGDKGAQSAFEYQIKKILEKDLKFAEEVSITIGDVDLSSIQAGDKSVIVKGSMTSSRVIYAETYVEGSVYKGPVPHNPQDALNAYRTVMASLTSSISMRGIDLTASDPNTQRAIGLANVYIDLDTTTQIELKETDGRIKKRAKDMADATGLSAEIEAELFRREGKTNPLSSLQAVVDNQFLVIKGNPGSGKSTFVSFLTYCLSTNTTDRLKYWKKEDADLLPVIVILRDFVKAFKKLPEHVEPHHIWDFIEKRLKDQNLSKASKPIQELLEEGKVILFLDGLDEVSTIPQRVFVRDAVHAFVKRFSKNHFVVTSRILSYVEPKAGEPNLRLTGFPEFELAPFSEQKIRSFIDVWYKELTDLGVVPPEIASELNLSLKTAVRRRELSKLAPNPLLLTVMAVVNTHKGRLPDARALLYKETVEILLWQWEQSSKGQEAARLRQLMLEAECADADLEQVICKLAFEAHAQTDGNSEDPETLAGISELSLQKGLASISKGDLNWAANVIETMKLRAGLLLERDNNVFTFPHRSFQEFLAGTYLDSKDDFVALAKELADNQLLWRQVILWAVSRRVYIRGSIDGPLALVAELCPSRDCKEEKEWSRVWLAGDILLEVGLNRVERSELGKELLLRVQNRLKELLEQSHLTPRERAEAGDTLAKLGDPRFDENYWHLPKEPLLGFVHITAGEFTMGTQEKDIKGLVEKFGGQKDWYENEVPQHPVRLPDYFMARYPVTVAQFKAFVEDSEYKPQVENSIRGILNHPVVYVTWYDALKYCEWLTARLKERADTVEIKTDVEKTFWQGLASSRLIVTLPSEAEWEKTARGADGRVFPWKENDITPNHANYSGTNINSTSAVGCFPQGRSPFEIQDMSGNVWEWTRSEFKKYPFDPNAKLEKVEDRNILRVLRGGAFRNDVRNVRCACSVRLNPYFRFNDFGFRVVVASPISPSSGS